MSHHGGHKRQGARSVIAEGKKDHPILNASVEGQEIHVRKDYHVGIAVAIGKTGLVAPVIRNAGQMNVIGLAHAASDLANNLSLSGSCQTTTSSW